MGFFHNAFSVVIGASKENILEGTSYFSVANLAPQFLLKADSQEHMSIKVDCPPRNAIELYRLIGIVSFPKRTDDLTVQLGLIVSDVLKIPNGRCIHSDLEEIPDSDSLAHGFIPNTSQNLG